MSHTKFVVTVTNPHPRYDTSGLVREENISKKWNNHKNYLDHAKTLSPRAVDPSTQTRNMNFGKFDSTGTLGRAYAPFIPGGGSHLEDDMTLKIPRGRLDDRLHLLRNLDRLKKEVDGTGTFEGIERFRGQALDVVLGGISDASVPEAAMQPALKRLS